jgi:hypothetical protein
MGRKGRRRTTQTAGSAWEILRGGPMPKGLIARLADIGSGFAGERAKADGIRGQVARHSADAQGRPDPIPTDPRSKKALDGLLALHGKLGRRKLVAPKVPAVVGGISGGRISVTITPPYDYALTIQTPPNNGVHKPATAAAAANKNGTLSCSAITTHERSMGSAYAHVGIFFHPLSAGTLRVSASPAYSFQWWTNSIGTREVQSGGSADINIYGLEQRTTQPGDFSIVSVAGTPFKRWLETETGRVRFDVGFDVQNPVSAQMSVGRGLVYLVFVTVHCHVLNAGWPGSLAGAMLSATVPSITWEFEPDLVASPYSASS